MSFVAALPDRDWTQPIVDNRTGIPDDCKLFNIVRPNLQKLSLSLVAISHSFDPPLGLEELHPHCVSELRKEGYRGILSVSKVHQFLQGSPNLRFLQLEGPCGRSPNGHELQPVNLPKLEKVSTVTSQVLHLFYAENCLDVSVGMKMVEERPPLRSWVTFARALRRVERLMIVVEDGSLNSEAVEGPYEIALGLCQIQARSEILDAYFSLYFKTFSMKPRQTGPSPLASNSGFSPRTDRRVVLTSISKSSNSFKPKFPTLLQANPDGESQTLIRSLCLIRTFVQARSDTLSILDPGLPSEALKTFVQRRSNGYCIEATSPIMGIFPRSSSPGGGGYYGDVLDEIMPHPARGNDG
ncbi:hypothetical protein M407DRAFT_4967 [Tulasnella calospora MUT 4182]|uniref:Uncharacterized protein n=1 Tax=Tulasnella calospora MUT 4182 TaxID=1051891 RepID=A0A0C3QTS0_9AGAM|nr:hypothetical protein M407DRAFT_4967 [Tulasnella calospora MUT 4182]